MNTIQNNCTKENIKNILSLNKKKRLNVIDYTNILRRRINIVVNS